MIPLGYFEKIEYRPACFLSSCVISNRSSDDRLASDHKSYLEIVCSQKSLMGRHRNLDGGAVQEKSMQCEKLLASNFSFNIFDASFFDRSSTSVSVVACGRWTFACSVVPALISTFIFLSSRVCKARPILTREGYSSTRFSYTAL